MAIQAAIDGGFVKKGDAVVITAGLPFDEIGTTNLIKVSRVGDPIESSSGDPTRKAARNPSG